MPRAERLNDPVFGALNPAEVRQIAEEIAGTPVPPTKRSLVPLIEFARWGAAVDKAGIIGNARRAFMETFGIEGGLKEDPENGAVAGIMKKPLDRLREKAGIPEDAKPKDLTHQQRVRFYQEFMKEPGYLTPVGGLAALDALRDEEVAAALFDTLFRNGSGGGTGAIQKAINRVDPGRVVVDKSFGSRTFQAFRRLTDDCGTRQQLLDALAEERETERREADPRGEVDGGDLDRFRYFRFLGSSACRGSEGAHAEEP